MIRVKVRFPLVLLLRLVLGIGLRSHRRVSFRINFHIRVRDSFKITFSNRSRARDMA